MTVTLQTSKMPQRGELRRRAGSSLGGELRRKAGSSLAPDGRPQGGELRQEAGSSLTPNGMPQGGELRQKAGSSLTPDVASSQSNSQSDSLSTMQHPHGTALMELGRELSHDPAIGRGLLQDMATSAPQDGTAASRGGSDDGASGRRGRTADAIQRAEPTPTVCVETTPPASRTIVYISGTGRDNHF